MDTEGAFRPQMDDILEKLARLTARVDSLADLANANRDDTAQRINVARDEVLHGLNRAFEAMQIKADQMHHNLYLHHREAARVNDLAFRDLMILMRRNIPEWSAGAAYIKTDTPVAIDTDDHNIPWGTAHDNTRRPRFVKACERHFSGPLTYVDLGCSGGGLVLDFLLRGHSAFGVEGSDFSQKALRAEWRLLPDRLFTADIAKPFTLRDRVTDAQVGCDVVSAWEVMEHIAEDDLPALFANVRMLLKPGGLFVGSIALQPDDDPITGASYHRTVQSEAWWRARFETLGLPFWDGHSFEFYDFCRGTESGPMDGDYSKTPEMGFHFVARAPR